VHLYRDDRTGFEALQHREMIQDYSWNKPAARYMDLFKQMLER
jgi:glycogen synthase